MGGLLKGRKSCELLTLKSTHVKRFCLLLILPRKPKMWEFLTIAIFFSSSPNGSKPNRSRVNSRPSDNDRQYALEISNLNGRKRYWRLSGIISEADKRWIWYIMMSCRLPSTINFTFSSLLPKEKKNQQQKTLVGVHCFLLTTLRISQGPQPSNSPLFPVTVR